MGGAECFELCPPCLEQQSLYVPALLFLTAVQKYANLRETDSSLKGYNTNHGYSAESAESAPEKLQAPQAPRPAAMPETAAARHSLGSPTEPKIRLSTIPVVPPSRASAGESTRQCEHTA
eukprot:2006907-Pyramimonas_sp.AAC.2